MVNLNDSIKCIQRFLFWLWLKIQSIISILQNNKFVGEKYREFMSERNYYYLGLTVKLDLRLNDHQCVRVLCRWTLVAGQRTERWGTTGTRESSSVTRPVRDYYYPRGFRRHATAIRWQRRRQRRQADNAGRESSAVDPVCSPRSFVSLNPHSLLLYIIA